ncbi:MAG: S-layer homology domain-containing protein [Lachnospiraceae bacterium]
MFTDVVEGKWYYEAVMTAYEKELMNGVTANTFEPMTAMNRAMLVTMLYRLEGSPEVEGSVSEVFADCKDTAYYAKAVLWASQNNIVSGRGESAFAPLATMTRQEMAVILYNYSVFKGAAEVTEPELRLRRRRRRCPWATAAVAYCGEAGLMTGVTDTEFAPPAAPTAPWAPPSSSAWSRPPRKPTALEPGHLSRLFLFLFPAAAVSAR